MLPLPAGREASAGVAAARYERHRPERTLLYQLVEAHYPALKVHLTAQGSTLPVYVEREFDEYLKCGRIEHGFLRVRCESCHAEHLAAFSCERRSFCASCGARRMADDCRMQEIERRRKPKPRVRRCWSMRCFLHNRCVNGC